MPIPVLTKPTMNDLAALVLCKGELYYQTQDGKTIKTVYPVTKEQAAKRAARLKVPWSEQ